jgi:YD repeat-containing protein
VEVDAIWTQHGMRHTYDAAGRRTSTTDAAGNRTLFYYDADGALTHTINALGEVTENRYDAHDRLTEQFAYTGRIRMIGLKGGLVTAALERATDNLAAHLAANPDQSLADVAYTLRVGRSPFAHRRAVAAATPEEAAEALRLRDSRRVATGVSQPGRRSVAFLLPGVGDQYPGMALGLYGEEPVFRQEIDLCAQGATEICGFIERNAAGTITRVRLPFFNAAGRLTRGVDTEASYTLPLSTFSDGWDGNLTFRALVNYMLDLGMDVGDALEALRQALDRIATAT